MLLEPLLHLLHLGYGEPCTLFGSGPWSRALYGSHPDVRTVLQLRNRHQPLAVSPRLWAMAATLVWRRAAAVYVCEPEPAPLARIRTLLALAGVPHTRCTFLADIPTQPDEHWVDRLLHYAGTPPADCASAWQAPVSTAAAPMLEVRDGDRRACATWLHARGWHGEAIWLVQPYNHVSGTQQAARDPSWDHKSWPMGRWVAVLQSLHAQRPDARIVLVGASREAPMLHAIADAARIPSVHVAARGVPLRRLIALAEIAAGMVSVDTGPAHVAAALGCPLVVLFGAAPPARWCPRSPTGSEVVPVGGPPARTRADEVPAGEVIAAVRALRPRQPRATPTIET